ncbi:hypothetical protein BGX27_009115 [Mortierella sp. AM989]|nr:hypothetical protein BGX27_009115 [Mortierella sp. AM989]
MIAVPPLGVGLNPFHDLILYVSQRAKGRTSILPTTAPGELSRLHQDMYMAALEELRKPGDVVSKKDVLVLLSTIINTLSTSGRRFSISRRIMKASLIPELTSDLCKPVKNLVRELLLALHPQIDHDRQCPPDFGQLKRMVWALLLDTTEKTESYTTLQIVNQILHWVELGIFAPPTSEHVYVSAWSLLINTLLLDTNIRATPGELVSKASTSARQPLTSCGKKVDMSIRIHVDNHWKSEIAIFEFKTSMASPETIRKWQGLNISRSYPIIAEGQALGLNFYTLRRYDDVLGAGKATAKGISLSSQVEHLKAFLESDAILTLHAFKEHLRRYAIDVTDILAISSSTPFESDPDDSYEDSLLTNPISRPSTPPSKKRVRPFVVFSPSKRDKKDSQFQTDLECSDDDDDAL